MPEVEYAEKELNELMRKYKENEVNKDIFFEEEKAAKIEAQRKENEARRKKALEDVKKDAGLADTEDLATAISVPVHPSEGGAPRDA
jgi:AAA15 family ATPase/GTPase